MNGSGVFGTSCIYIYVIANHVRIEFKGNHSFENNFGIARGKFVQRTR